LDPFWWFCTLLQIFLVIFPTAKNSDIYSDVDTNNHVCALKMANPHHQPCRLEQCPSFTIQNPSGWTIQGHSRAGERTGFAIKDLGIVLDGGLASFKSPKALFITHSHCDHTLCIPQLVCGRSAAVKGQESLRGRPLYCPIQIVPKIHLLNYTTAMLSWDDTNVDMSFDCETIESAQGYQCVGVMAGQSHDIPGVPGIRVEILRAFHSAGNCVGYGFSKICKKLKDEYAHLKGTREGGWQLAKLRQAGVDVTENTVQPEMAFYCDSSIDNLRSCDEWKKYPVVVCECTGYAPYQESEKMYLIQHSHLDDLKPIMIDHPEKQWILIHASMSIPEIFLEEQEAKLREECGLNVSIWRSENPAFGVHII
jgi:ribonuclease Z